MRSVIFRHQDYRSFLDEEFANRRDRNPAYSLRAFARDLKVAPSTLSGLLSKRHGLSPGRAGRIALQLDMSAEEKTYFCRMVEAEEGRTESRKRKAQAELAAIKAIWTGNANRITVYLEIPRDCQNVVTARVSAFKQELESLVYDGSVPKKDEDHLMRYAVEFVCQPRPLWSQAQLV